MVRFENSLGAEVRPHSRDEQEQIAGQETDTEESGRLGSSTVTHVGEEGESAHGKVGVAYVEPRERPRQLAIFITQRE